MSSRKRWSARFGGIVTVLLVAAVCIVAPARAAVPGAVGLVPTTVRVSPASGPPGTLVTVRGTGFDPGICRNAAGIRWRGAGLASFTAVTRVTLRADGTFTGTVRAPSRGLLGGSSARLVTTCGPGLVGLPGPRAWFRLTPAVAPPPAARPPAGRPTAAPTTRPTVKPTPEPTRKPTAEPTGNPGSGSPGNPAGNPTRNPGGGAGGAGGSGSGSGSGAGGGAGSGSGSGSGAGGGGQGAGSTGGSGDPLEIAIGPTSPTGPTGGTAAAGTPSIGPGAGVLPPAGPGAGTTTGPTAGPTGVVLAARSPAGASNSAVQPVRPAMVTASLPTAPEAGFALRAALIAAALAALFVVLVAFPADLFNSTYGSNADEIKALLAYPVRWLRRAVVQAGATPGQARAGIHRAGLGFVAFIVIGTLLTVILAGNESAGGNWPAQIIGLLIAIPVVTLVAELPSELSARRFSGGIEGRFRVLPVAVAIAVVCTLLSRLLGLEPAYMYGLFAGFATVVARPLTEPQEGRATLAGIGAVAAFGVACWLVWGPVHAAAYAGDAGWGTVLLDSTLFWCFVLATEGLVFALIPLTFLDGATLRAWHPLAWLIPQVAAAAFFFYVFVLHGSGGEVGSDVVLRALTFFVIFGLLSLAFWAYFRWEGRPSHAVVADLQRTTP